MVSGHDHLEDNMLYKLHHIVFTGELPRVY